MTDTNRFADDISEFTVTIRSYDNRIVDVSDLIASISLYQSIFTPAITAKIIFSDRVNFLNTFPLNGEETIKLTFTSIPNSKKTDLNLFIFDCENIDISSSLEDMSYTVYAASIEAFTDLYQPIQKAYSGAISDMVKDIYKTFLKSQRPVTVEQTKGTFDLIIPKLTPFQALSFLKKRAVSTGDTTSVFMSFETTEGFIFASLENLIKSHKDRAESSPDYQFKLEHAVTLDPTQVLLDHNILALKPHRKFNTLEETKLGAFYSRAWKFDLLEKQLSTVDFKLADKYPAWTTMAGTGSLKNALHSAQFMSDFDNNSMRQYFYVYDKNRKEDSLADTVGAKGAYFVNLLQNEYEIVISGNNLIIPGDVIKVTIPNLATGNSDDAFEQRMNGLFFVADVTHVVVSQTKFYTKLLCYKDSNVQ